MKFLFLIASVMQLFGASAFADGSGFQRIADERLAQQYVQALKTNLESQRRLTNNYSGCNERQYYYFVKNILSARPAELLVEKLNLQGYRRIRVSRTYHDFYMDPFYTRMYRKIAIFNLTTDLKNISSIFASWVSLDNESINIGTIERPIYSNQQVETLLQDGHCSF